MIPQFKVFMPKTVDDELLRVLHSGFIGQGEKVNQFEKDLGDYFGNKNVLTINSGTGALQLALRLANVTFGDEVISTPMTCTATNMPILAAGAKIVWCDVDPVTGLADPDSIESKITKKTKAIIVTHTYGFPCDMDKIINICKKNKIIIIEDAAEMVGQTYKGRPCGSFGDISIISLYANKHITTGEGGMILTNKRKIHEKACSLRNLSFGTKNRFNHDDIGWNYRFTNMQAALGLSQLKRIKNIIKTKKKLETIIIINLKIIKKYQYKYPFKIKKKIFIGFLVF